MRNTTPTCVAVVLPLVLVFLAAVPQGTHCEDPMTIARTAASVIGPIVTNFTNELRTKRDTEKIKIRVWMHKGDAQLNGCGYYIQVNGNADGVGFEYFPDEVVHKCGADQYQMRMTSQNVMYEKEVHLGNELASTIELHADGWHNTFANVICIGLNEPTIAGGPRAFCINNDFLRACKGLMSKWSDIYLEWNDIMLSRSSRGTHKIVFRDIENLVNGSERLSQNPNDTNAVWSVCVRIDLVKGTYSEDFWDCAAKKTWNETHFDGSSNIWETMYKDEYKNPYGCERYTNGE